MAIRLKNLQGKEVITTPFTYVATASALLWENCVPVFADIDEETLCLSPQTAAPAVTENTAAILPVHIYGNACDTDAFDALAQNILSPAYTTQPKPWEACTRADPWPQYGDVVTLSLHATTLRSAQTAETSDRARLKSVTPPAATGY